MERDPIILRTLTPEEKESIPVHILQKIQIEIRNLHSIHQTAISTLKKKINKKETLLSSAKAQLQNYLKKINQCELEKHIQSVESSVLKSKIHSLERENNFVVRLLKKKEPKTVTTTHTDYENKKKTIEGLIDSIVSKDNDLSNRLEKYIKENKLLTSKVNSQKKQLNYLLDSSEDSSQQKINLIRMIQTLSKENDRLLSEEKPKGAEVEKLKTTINEKNKKIEELEDKIANYVDLENNFTFLEQKKYLEEIEILSREKNSLYNQFMALYTSKLDLENKINELEEDSQKKNKEIETLISKQRNLDQVVEKYNEVSNELIRSNIVVREYRLKIIDLTKKLEESEERYSTYILSNRTDIVALLGRELGYMRKKIVLFANNFGEITNFYDEFKEEQDRLTEMYKSKCIELEDNRIKLNKYEKQQVVMNDIVSVIPNEMHNVLNDLYEMFNEISQNAVLLFEHSDKTISDYKTNIFILKNDLNEKEQIIKSLIENNSDIVDSLVKHENNMLKNEIVLLNAKLDNLQSEEYTDVIEKLEQLRTENESIREYVTNLNSEILKKEHTIRNLEDNLQEINIKLETKELLITKYERIIEKLRKVKDAYVVLKQEKNEKPSMSVGKQTSMSVGTQEKNQQKNTLPLNTPQTNTPQTTTLPLNTPQTNTNLSFKYLDTPPNKEKIISDIQDENVTSIRRGKRSLPMLSTENFVISENHGERNPKRK